MPAVQRFARVLRAPDIARLLGAAVLARMPIGIDSLAMVLFVRAETGSFARAGLVVAAFGLAIGVSAPALGRLIDHHAHARVMLPLAGLHAASLGALVALGVSGAPTGALVACSLAAGLSSPPVGSVVRPLLSGRRTSSPRPTRSTASPSSWSSSPGRCSPRRSSSSPRRPRRSWSPAGS